MNRAPDLEAVRRADPTDVARRIVERRDELCIDDLTLAHQAAMSPAYLRYLLAAGPAFDPAGFVRIAAALRMTWAELLEGRSDAPPGQSQPVPGTPRPLLLHLSEPECWFLVGTHGVGRVGLPGSPAPTVYPVNYAVDGRTIVYHTTPHGSAAAEDGSPLSFQVDHIDDRLSEGWSVLMLGSAHHVDDPEEEQRLSRLPGATPWAGGDRPLWVRITPDEVTGRRLGAG
ncbi:pyridoxamine 5'-phosphate oxidase family protein [Kitasatospora sp. NPDC058032]|uniref:pyridoxamine 5'-phosphate oxidase family protein n=1 Tax=Kitasatospora sp. NPDC058032 TaxID=3346307 RepID=UPI0036D9B091